MYNKVELIGRAGADPTIKTLEGGTEYATMNLATTERYYDQEKKEQVEITDWHMVVAWRKMAKSLSYVKKGKLLMVVGKLKTRKYTDKSGVERYITEVVADEIHFLERMQERTESNSHKQGDQTNETSGKKDFELE